MRTRRSMLVALVALVVAVKARRQQAHDDRICEERSHGTPTCPRCGDELEESGVCSCSPRYRLHLSHAPNLDLSDRGGYWNPTMAEEELVLSLHTFTGASDCVLAYIESRGLGGGNWTGGLVTEEGTPVASISYNGRVWALRQGQGGTFETTTQVNGMRWSTFGQEIA